VIAFRDAGYVVASYAVTFAGIAFYAWNLMRRARKAAKQVPVEDRPWT